MSKHSLTHRFPFLFQETELRLVKFLPEILALQRDLVRQFQNTAEIKHCSIREFLREPHSGEKTTKYWIVQLKVKGKTHIFLLTLT